MRSTRPVLINKDTHSFKMVDSPLNIYTIWTKECGRLTITPEKEKGKGLPQTVATNLEAKHCLKCHGMLKH